MDTRNITGIKAKKLHSTKGAVIVDVRDPVAFRDGTLPDAINLSLRQLSQLQAHPRTTPIILVGEGHTDPTLKAAINYIELYGFDKVFSLGSIDNWNK